MCGEVVEETFVIGALSILKTLELNLTRLLLFSDVDLFASVGKVAGLNGVDDVKLKCPDNVGGVFDISAFLETLKGNRLDIVVTIERRYDYESAIGVALELFKFANRVINTDFG